MPDLPEYLYVENLSKVKRKEMEEAYKIFKEEFPTMGYYDRLIAEAGWFSEEQRNDFNTIKRRGN